MILEDWFHWFPSHKETLPIKLHQNIQHSHFSTDRLNIIQGAVECNLIHNTIYCLTLNGWSKCIHQIPQIAWHFWSARDKLSIEEGLPIKGKRLCISPELYGQTLEDLHDIKRCRVST